MKYCLNKEQVQKLIDKGEHVNETYLTAYEDVLESHAYVYKNGKYKIFENPTIDEVLRMHVPFFVIQDKNDYQFDIVQSADGKWSARYIDENGKELISSTEEELIDALFELYIQK